MNSKRYLGLELSGAKNSKTTLANFEYYKQEHKLFLLDIQSGIGADHETDSDQVLLQTIQDHAEGSRTLQICVNVPLSLPPALMLRSSKKSPLDSNEVKWMKKFFQERKTKNKPLDFFTPYTQRPVELWLKILMLQLPEKLRFEIDETLGGNKAPLTARMNFLKFYLKEYPLFEAIPKLTITLLAPVLKLSQKATLLHRQLEGGAYYRQLILDKMMETFQIFIYERDQKKIIQNLNAFDAFVCGVTVYLKDQNKCISAPEHFPLNSGWILYPKSIYLSTEENER